MFISIDVVGDLSEMFDELVAKEQTGEVVPGDVASMTFEQLEGKIDYYDFIADSIMEQSQILCPVDTGKLKASVKKVKNSDGTVDIEYNTDYAIWVHEVLGNYHNPPTQSKFLEDAGYMVLYNLGNDNAFTFEMLYYSNGSIALRIGSVDFEYMRNVMHNAYNNLTMGIEDLD